MQVYQELICRESTTFDYSKYLEISIEKRHPLLSKTLELIFLNLNHLEIERVASDLKKILWIYKRKSFTIWWKFIQEGNYSEFMLKWGAKYDKMSLVYLIKIYLKLIKMAIESINLEFLSKLDFLRINVCQIWIIFGNDDSLFVEYLFSRLELENLGVSSKNLQKTSVFNQMNHFFRVIGYDKSLIIDLLISNETEFLEFFLKYLIKILKEFQEFTKSVKYFSNLIKMFTKVVSGLQTLALEIPFSTLPLQKRLIMVIDKMKFFSSMIS